MATSLFAAPLGTPKFRAFSAAGAPLAGGTLNVYLAGSTTNTNSYPTYVDALAGTNANANPVGLDANGEANIWLPILSAAAGLYYKLVLKDSGGVVQWTVDNYTGAYAFPLSSLAQEWTVDTNTSTYISATQFRQTTVDSTGTYHVGRRVRISNSPGTVWGTVTAVSFSNDTTVTVKVDAGGIIANTMSAVAYGTNSYVNPSYLDPRTVVGAQKNGNMTGFGSSTQVATWTEDVDSNNEFTSNTFTCVYPGNYLISGGVELSDTGATQAVTVQIKKGGATVVGQNLGYSHVTPGNHTTHVIPAKALTLAAGDTIGLYVTGTANTTVYGTVGSVLNVSRIA